MPNAIDELLEPPFDQPVAPRWIEPDLMVLDDLSGPAALRLLASRQGGRLAIADPARIVIASSLDLDTAWEERRREHEAMRAFADAYQIRFHHDPGTCREGCPPTLEAPPNSIVIAAGTPPPGVSARGGVSARVTSEDLAAALITGAFWFRRPAVRAVCVSGSFSRGVTVHDLAIALRPRIEHGEWALVEFDSDHTLQSAAPALAALLMRESRAEYLTCRLKSRSPKDTFDDGDTIDLTALGPMIGLADRDGATPWSEAAPEPIDRVYIGSCTTGSVDDLRLAALVLHGHKVAAPTIIAPASENDLERLSHERLDESDAASPTLFEVFQSAGCDVGHPGCAGCVNALADAFADRDAPERELRVVATAVANVTTRRVARVFTASPITAAHCAISGALGAPTHRSRVEIGV